MKSLAGLAGLTLCASFVNASEPFPFDSPRWQIEAEENRIEEYKGKTSLLLRGGLALIADAEFADGVIEYFCAFPEARAFVGATWRVQDAANREEFYIRLTPVRKPRRQPIHSRVQRPVGVAALPRGGLRRPDRL